VRDPGTSFEVRIEGPRVELVAFQASSLLLLLMGSEKDVGCSPRTDMRLTTCRSVCHPNRRERLIRIVAVTVVAAERMCRVRWSPQPLMHTSA